jgi:hypothetical protein
MYGFRMDFKEINSDARNWVDSGQDFSRALVIAALNFRVS